MDNSKIVDVFKKYNHDRHITYLIKELKCLNLNENNTKILVSLFVDDDEICKKIFPYVKVKQIKRKYIKRVKIPKREFTVKVVYNPTLEF